MPSDQGETARPWSWSSQEHPRVLDVFKSPTVNLDLWDRLEKSASDAVTGKVLCVCAALAIARECLAKHGAGLRDAADSLKLLSEWIDDPTVEQFERMEWLVFADEAPELDPSGATWWALRTAMSHPGVYEAGWALQGTCDAAVELGFEPETLREIVKAEINHRTATA